MRIEINLASQPYQDERQFYVTWGSVLGAVALLTILLTTFALLRFRDTRMGWRQVEQKREKIAQLQQEENAAVAILNRPENSGTRARSEFLNEAILRKSFSWTEVLADLERLMPPRVHIVSIAPTIDKGNRRLTVRMDVSGETRQQTVDLLMALEKSKHFRFPQLINEASGGEGPARGVKAQIEADYIPAGAKPTAQERD